MTFGSPDLLLGLLALPIAVAGYAFIGRRRRRKSEAWSRKALLPNLVRGPSRGLRELPVSLVLVGLVFLLVGVARPERVTDAAQSQAGTVVLAFDVSGSMAAKDVVPTRLLAARRAAINFVDRLPSRDQVGVVTFGAKVRVVVQPTPDHAAVIAGIPATITPRSGTSLGDGVSEAVAVIVQTSGVGRPGRRVQPGAVLLFSDGSQTLGGTTPEEAAATAYVSGIPVDSVALGTPTGLVTQTVKVDGFETSTQFPVPVDQTVLRQVSDETRGVFLGSAPSGGSGNEWKAIYENLGAGTPRSKSEQQLSAFAAAGALVFVLSGLVLSGVWYGRVT
jgi:Ca-activated chloride channel homolog